MYRRSLGGGGGGGEAARRDDVTVHAIKRIREWGERMQRAQQGSDSTATARMMRPDVQLDAMTLLGYSWKSL
jgi:hypothetical protein